MSTRTFLEVEAKFAVDEQVSVPDLTRIGGVAALASTRHHHLSAVYYDTADLRLTRSRITLRRRSGGADDGWHLKLPGSGARLEVHSPFGEPVDSQFQVPEELLAQVRVLIRTEPLIPIAQVDNERAESDLVAPDGSPLAEFCDDRVTAWSLLPGGTQTSWREWEVELADQLVGTTEGTGLIQSATGLLIGAGARVSSSPSKLVAALGDSINHAPLPPFMRIADLDEDSPAAAVVAALRLNRDKLLDYDPKVRRDEWDSIHQMRVATRELRSHMETFEGVLGGTELRHVESELKLLAGVLGVARDAEVVEERFLMLLDSEDSDVLDETTREHLRADMGAEYRRAHRRVVSTLNSERYLSLLNAVDALLADPPVITGPTTTEHLIVPPGTDAGSTDGDDEDGQPIAVTDGGPVEPETKTTTKGGKLSKEEKKGRRAAARREREDVEKILSAHLAKAHKKLMKRHRRAVKNWDNPDLTLHEREEYYHDMRKSAKKLRYAAEAVGSATRLKTGRLYRACKELQSILGDFQDSVTSRDKLLTMAAAAARRGEDTFGYGMLYQRERTIGMAALEDYDKAVRKITAAYERLMHKAG